MKILLLDIETSPNLAYVWGLFKQNVAINQIKESGSVLCWAAKWYGSRDVMFDSAHKYRRYQCSSCGGWFRGHRTVLRPAEERPVNVAA